MTGVEKEYIGNKRVNIALYKLPKIVEAKQLAIFLQKQTKVFLK